MTEEIAEIIKELPGRGHQLYYTKLSNGYWVSTIERINKEVDEAITTLMKHYGVTPADLDRVGDLSMPGDFETMVFTWTEYEEDYTELAFARYETKEEAEAGHKEMVERWRRMPPPTDP